MEHEYWIGDRVWVSSLNRHGTFEGTQDGMALVKIGHHLHHLSFSDITISPEEEDVGVLLGDLLHEDKRTRLSKADFPDTLDLHIDTLNPQLVHAEPAQILSHQRSRLRDYLDTAIALRVRQVTIIHGKGEGVLQAEVLNVLKDYSEVQRVEHESHGGAVRVVLHQE